MKHKHKQKQADIRCPHCGFSNPPKAYACISCFKIMYPKQKVPFWKMQIQSHAAVLLVSFSIFAALFMVLRQWLHTVEAEITVNIQAADYSLSVVADKARARARLRTGDQNKEDPSETPSK